MKRMKEVSKKKCLFITELERPVLAAAKDKSAKCDKDGWATTLAVGEEATKAD